jgi:hypothetical protein
MVNLGDEVKDTVTGFQGIVVAKTNYIHGCTRVSVQPKVGKDKKVPEAQAFDEPALKVIKAGVVKRSHNDTGGPKMATPQSKAVGR